MAYDEIDPVGKFRDDFGWAQVSSLIYNFAMMVRKFMQSDKGSALETKTTLDFLPKWEERSRRKQMKKEVKVQPIEDMKKVLLRWAGMVNRQHKEKRKK